MTDIDPNLPKETDAVPPVTPKPDQPPAEPTAEEILRKENEELRTKFGASTTENQILQSKLTAAERAQQESTKEPTDSEYRTAFPEWDTLSETEKQLAKRTFIAERNSQNAVAITTTFKQEREWATSIELASTNPRLQGKEDAFKKYALKPQYRGSNIDLLISAFLGELPAQTRPTPAPGLLPGNGGPRTPEKPQHISAQDLATLRKTDERAYMEYVKTHEINVDSL